MTLQYPPESIVKMIGKLDGVIATAQSNRLDEPPLPVRLINYGDENYRLVQVMNAVSAIEIGQIDDVQLYTEADIDPDFRAKHRETLAEKRGGGLWLWKPYFILQALSEVPENHYVFYCDSGAGFQRSFKEFFSLAESLDQSIQVFASKGREREWNKRDTVLALDADSPEILDSYQVKGGYVLARNDAFARRFLNEWLELGTQKHLIDDTPSVAENDLAFRSHRHDQSLLSLLSKKHGLKFHKSCDQFQQEDAAEIFPHSIYDPFLITKQFVLLAKFAESA